MGGFVIGASGICPIPGSLGVASAVLGLIGGGVVAVGRINGYLLRSGYFLACGYVLGLSVPTQFAGRDVALCGSLVVMVPIAIGFYLSLLPDRPVWLNARRVMGSWIVAVSLLVFAFSIKYGQGGAGRSSVQGDTDRAPRSHLGCSGFTGTTCSITESSSLRVDVFG